MKRTSVKRNVIRITIAYLCILCAVFIAGIYRLHHEVEQENSADMEKEYVVQLNEVRKLYESDPGQADRKLESLMEEMRQQKSGEKQADIRNIIFFFGISIGMVLILFLYVYILVLRPFDELEEYAKNIASGNLESELPYHRVNLFGSFTWAFDHMRTEILHARKNEQAAIENNKTVMATLSHDIKTPIASIRGYAEALVMQMDATQERRERYANVIMKKCDEVTKITNDMFLHSLHDLDHLVVKQEKVAIDQVIKDSLAEAGNDMEIILDEEIVKATLQTADAGRIAQVIDNILSNAEKYAKGSAIRVKTQIVQGNQMLEQLQVQTAYELSIRDFGAGIADEDVPFVFEKFYRGKNVQEEPGAGLGLFIVHYIMERMHGEARLVNHKDGLEVLLYFPTE